MAKGRGFTVVEVMLFLAVSAMLLGIAFAYTSSTLRNARYSDAAKSFEAFIEQQYSEVQAGTATRNSAPGTCVASALGASDTCVVLGRLITLEDSTQINQYTVVADATSTGFSDDFQAFKPSPTGTNPRVQETIDNPVGTYSLDWGTQLYWKRYQLTSGAADFNRIAILRSPISESIYIFTFRQTVGVLDGLPGTADNLAGKLISARANKQAVICISSQDFGTASSSLMASITLSGSATIDSIGSVIKPKSDVRVGALACQ